MRKLIGQLACLSTLLMVAATSFAQEVVNKNEPVQMADGLRASGKIYVVVAVVVTIVTGMILYLLRIEKKITRLEKGDK